MFRPTQDWCEQLIWQNHAMSRQYFDGLYKAVRQDVMKDSNEDLYWIVVDDSTPIFFFGLL